MERETNQTQQPTLCRNGCGFYGNPSTDGMCSKCWKDALRRKQSSPTANTGIHSTSSSHAMADHTTCLSSSVDGASAMAAVAPVSTAIGTTSSATSISSTESIEDRQSSAGVEAGTSSESKEKGKKRNRCFMCRKKVGLTGFECRCGNIFCGLHRYSDKHDCTFDYKAEGKAKILKDNPVILAEKIQKI